MILTTVNNAMVGVIRFGCLWQFYRIHPFDYTTYNELTGHIPPKGDTLSGVRVSPYIPPLKDVGFTGYSYNGNERTRTIEFADANRVA